MTALNPFLRAARAAKTFALVAHIDNHARNTCSDYTPAQLVDALRDMDPDWWNAMARDARVNAPSAETVAAIIEVFESRCEPALREVRHG